MMPSRSAGLLLHPTSLPGPFGIGDFGPTAHRWIETLVSMKQAWWQILPLGPTGAGDTITITFNQAITTASGPVAANNICTNTGGTVMLGVTGSGTTCSTATATTIGMLTALTINRAARYAATYAWSAGNTVPP